MLKLETCGRSKELLIKLGEFKVTLIFDKVYENAINKRGYNLGEIQT